VQDRYEWAQVREDAVERFNGELPHAETEAEIIEVFEQHPSVVLRGVQEVAEAVANGRARSGWAVLRARVKGANDPLREATAYGNERELAVQQAERWIVNAGLHVDRPEEIESEFFGEGGSLERWAGDVTLKKRLIALWCERRPVGIQVEAEQAERLGSWRSKLLLADSILKARKGGFKGFVEPDKADEDEWAAV